MARGYQAGFLRGGGGGGAVIVATRSDNNQPAVFATFAALETYTATTEGTADAARINVSDALQAREAFVVGTLTNNAFVGDVTAYVRVNGAWVLSVLPLRGQPGQDGQDGQDGNAATVAGLTDNTVPIKDPNNDQLIDGPFAVDSTTGRVKANMGLEVPPGTIYIGANTAISAAIRALNVRSDITGNTGLILAQLYDETNGFSRPFGYSGTDITTVAVNPSPGTATSDTARFDITTTADELLFKVDIPTANPNTSGPFTLVIRTQSHTGPIAVDHSETLTTNAAGVATLDFRENFNPILVDNNTQLFVTATCQDIQGTQSGADFIPNAIVHRIVVARETLAFQSDIPSPVTPRTDEEIFNVIADAIIAGTNVTIDRDDAANTLTINGPGGGSTPPTPIPSNDLRYGLSAQSDPTLVVFANLTDVASPTDPQTVSTGTTTAGQYFHIFSSNTHDIQSIRDTVLDQIVYQEGGTGNIFTKTSDARTEGSVTYDAYTIGPLNAGVDEDYVLNFS